MSGWATATASASPCSRARTSTGLTAARGLAADLATFTVAAFDADLLDGEQMAIDAKSFVVSCPDVALTVARRLDADVCAYTLTGVDAALTQGTVIVPEYLDLRVRAELSADILIEPSLGFTKRIAACRGMTTALDGAPSLHVEVDASGSERVRGRACLSGDLVGVA